MPLQKPTVMKYRLTSTSQLCREEKLTRFSRSASKVKSSAFTVPPRRSSALVGRHTQHATIGDAVLLPLPHRLSGTVWWRRCCSPRRPCSGVASSPSCLRVPWAQGTPRDFLYLHRRLASEGIVTLGVTLSCCHVVCVSAALVSAAKVMRCIQCSLVFNRNVTLQFHDFTPRKVAFVYYYFISIFLPSVNVSCSGLSHQWLRGGSAALL